MSEVDHEPHENRNALRAMGRGFVGKCPNCGEGKMFSGFLTLRKCEVCGEDLDQFEPSLLLPLAVGLVIVAIVAHVYFFLEVSGVGSPMISILVIVPIATIASILILRPFKGALVGLLWALRTKRSWQD